ncbi:MAG: cold shock and DUF1294 domain-containing protein [Cardiobacteriaceae bacterium]|nr:cold shock and DUF1294 domain-containing protein [Cardiobacteriaceae bacterium]
MTTSTTFELIKALYPDPTVAIDGVVSHWNDTKGFGFITLSEYPQISLFFHASAYAYREQRPKLGEAVVLQVEQQGERIRARRVLRKEHTHALSESAHYDANQPQIFLAVAYLIFSLIYWLLLSGYSLALTLTSIINSIVTFKLYQKDKKAANSRKFRIPENVLYLAALLGGWPGAYIARYYMRHKVRKLRFSIFLSASMVIHFVGICLYVSYTNGLDLWL